MTEKEVKDYIGEDNWDTFLKWMAGQTLGSNEDGTLCYYDHDVEAFKKKLDTGYDRQKDPFNWD